MTYLPNIVSRTPSNPNSKGDVTMENQIYDARSAGMEAKASPTLASLLGQLEELEKSLLQNDSIAAEISGRMSGSAPRAVNSGASTNKGGNLLANFNSTITACMDSARSTYNELDRLRNSVG